MDVELEVVFIVIFVVLLHLLIFYYLTRKKKSVEGKHIVVTGGSSGIGLWIAIHAARAGAHVTIVARKISLMGKHTK